ncbi:MAG: hypothetical protein NTU76_04455 [Candidatus Taylorbacteria bacterium]|nr:hypothetical protein [Candidatus Taylorbacteria bacterium]
MNKQKLYWSVGFFVVIIGLLFFLFYRIGKDIGEANVLNSNNNSIVYENTDYGFDFSLPANWQGYSIIKSTWQGTALKNISAPTGTKLLIRNPNWTETAHYEDIPILIFTISQWDSYLAENFSISAAPIQASELARNNTYVFALPPRWNFDYSLGYKEAEEIIARSPLSAFNK